MLLEHVPAQRHALLRTVIAAAADRDADHRSYWLAVLSYLDGQQASIAAASDRL